LTQTDQTALSIKLLADGAGHTIFWILTGLIRKQFERLSEIIRELSTRTRPTKRQDGDKTGFVFKDLRRSKLERVFAPFSETPAIGPATLSIARRTEKASRDPAGARNVRLIAAVRHYCFPADFITAKGVSGFRYA
jgi:hypothetical protein